MIVTNVIKKKNRIKGYEIEDKGEKRVVPRQSIIYLIRTGRIENATVQTIKDGREVVRVNKQTSKIDSVKSCGTIADDVAIAVKLSAGEKVELSGTNAISILHKLHKGTPLKVKLSDSLDWKQCIMLGVGEDPNKGVVFKLFDGSGVTGLFQLSQRTIQNPNGSLSHNEIKFMFNDNDPVETSFLINYMKKGPFNNKLL